MELNIKKQKKINFTAVTLIMLFIFLFALRNNLVNIDVDLGWHLRVGKDLIVNHIFPKYDIYTFSHNIHSWVDHEWLADTITYLIYNKTNFLFLAFIFSLVILGTFLLEIKMMKKIFSVNNMISIVFVIIGIISILGFVAVRMQIITWLGLATTIYLLLDHYYKKDGKILFWLPIIFLTWTNLHGGFFVGLFLLFLYTLFAKHNKKTLIVVCLLSFAATFINPYGWKIWEEIIRTVGDSYGKSHILEWSKIWEYPLNLFDFIYLLIFIIILFWKQNYKKIPLAFLIFAILMFFSSIMHKRNMPILVISSLPFLAYLTDNIIGKKTLKKYFQINFILIITLIFINITMLLAMMLKLNYIFTDPYKNPEIYPYETVNYLKENKVYENTFVNFSLGGYLLWTMPKNYKVFYDGRMIHWKSKDERFIDEYLAINNAQKNWEDIINKYGIKYIVIAKKSNLTKLKANDWLNRLFYSDLINNINKENTKLKDYLEKKNWDLIYENQDDWIYKKN